MTNRFRVGPVAAPFLAALLSFILLMVWSNT